MRTKWWIYDTIDSQHSQWVCLCLKPMENSQWRTYRSCWSNFSEANQLFINRLIKRAKLMRTLLPFNLRITIYARSHHQWNSLKWKENARSLKKKIENFVPNWDGSNCMGPFTNRLKNSVKFVYRQCRNKNLSITCVQTKGASHANIALMQHLHQFWHCVNIYRMQLIPMWHFINAANVH